MAKNSVLEDAKLTLQISRQSQSMESSTRESLAAVGHAVSVQSSSESTGKASLLLVLLLPTLSLSAQQRHRLLTAYLGSSCLKQRSLGDRESAVVVQLRVVVSAALSWSPHKNDAPLVKNASMRVATARRADTHPRPGRPVFLQQNASRTCTLRSEDAPRRCVLAAFLQQQTSHTVHLIADNRSIQIHSGYLASVIGSQLCSIVQLRLSNPFPPSLHPKSRQ